MIEKLIQGVTIPSQIRYVHYFSIALDNGWTPLNMPSPKMIIHKLKLTSVPNMGVFGGCGY